MRPAVSLRLPTRLVCALALGTIATMCMPAAGHAFAPAKRRAPTVDLDAHAFPALGAGSARRVDVAWNRFYDHAGLNEILRRLHEAFPDLTKLSLLGKSVEGREIWCLQVTAPNGDASRKTAMYIDGNIHGNEVQGGEAVAYTAWYLLHQYERLPSIKRLLEDRTFYLIPSINPDGRDHWFHAAQTSSSSRTGVAPIDNDRDGKVDEDDVDDLDGNGSITWMRIRDPYGRYKPHPDFPEFAMVQVEPDEKGEYDLLGFEGIDNDGDGRINEDPLGGYDPNRNWAYDWQPNYVQYGAHHYPFSLPESKAIADFVVAHPNIAAMQSYHNAGGMILRGPGREGGLVADEDEEVMSYIADIGEKILPAYRSMVIWKDLYTVWGGEVDWFYGGRGITAFTNELWTSANLYRSENTSRDEQNEFLRRVLQADGVVPWAPYDHPTYGKIEIGGTKKTWGRVPPSFLLEEELHRNMAFTLFHADMMPKVRIADVTVDKLSRKLFRVRVTIENERPLPTRTAHDVAHHISASDVVSLEGTGLNVLAAGRIVDRYFGTVEPVDRRPQRVEIDQVDGNSIEQVEFIVSGRGRFTILFDSQKGGRFEYNGRLGREARRRDP